jgi:hypothetical protein
MPTCQVNADAADKLLISTHRPTLHSIHAQSSLLTALTVYILFSHHNCQLYSDDSTPRKKSARRRPYLRSASHGKSRSPRRLPPSLTNPQQRGRPTITLCSRACTLRIYTSRREAESVCIVWDRLRLRREVGTEIR